MLLFFLLSASSIPSNSWRVVAGFHDWNADAESFGDSFSLKCMGRLKISNSEISSNTYNLCLALV